MVYNAFHEIRSEIDSIFNNNRLYSTKFGKASDFIRSAEVSEDLKKEGAAYVNALLEDYVESTKGARTSKYLAELGDTISNLNHEVGYSSGAQSLADILKDSVNSDKKNVFVDKQVNLDDNYSQQDSWYEIKHSNTSRKKDAKESNIYNIEFETPVQDTYNSLEDSGDDSEIIDISELCKDEPQLPAVGNKAGYAVTDSSIEDVFDHSWTANNARQNVEEKYSGRVRNLESQLKAYMHEKKHAVSDVKNRVVDKLHSFYNNTTENIRKAGKNLKNSYKNNKLSKTLKAYFSRDQESSGAQNYSANNPVVINGSAGKSRKKKAGAVGAALLLSATLVAGTYSSSENDKTPKNDGTYIEQTKTASPDDVSKPTDSDSIKKRLDEVLVRETAKEILEREPPSEKPNQPSSSNYSGIMDAEKAPERVKIGSFTQPSQVEPELDELRKNPKKILSEANVLGKQWFSLQDMDDNPDTFTPGYNEKLIPEGLESKMALYQKTDDGWNKIETDEAVKEGQIALGLATKDGLDVVASVDLDESTSKTDEKVSKETKAPESNIPQGFGDNLEVYNNM